MIANSTTITGSVYSGSTEIVVVDRGVDHEWRGLVQASQTAEAFLRGVIVYMTILDAGG